MVLGSASLMGGIVGGVLLLTLPSSVFRRRDPDPHPRRLRLVIVQPRLSVWVAARRTEHVEHGGIELYIGVFLTGIYGGYFGAAQGVILLALLGIFIVDDLQRLNGVKNVLATIANGVAAIVFVFAAARGVGGRGADRGRLGRRRPARRALSGAGCRLPCCACVIVVVGRDRRGQAAGDVAAATGRARSRADDHDHGRAEHAEHRQQHDPVAEAHVRRLPRHRR